MEVRRVEQLRKENINGGRLLVRFKKCNEEVEVKNKSLQYKEDDIVFIEKDSKDKDVIKEYHSYNGLMKYLNKIDKQNEVNKTLVLNKFTNIFNISSSYLNNNVKEKSILHELQQNTKFIRENFAENYKWKAFSTKLNDKLIVGLGNESVFETDITLHHTYGVPYIPGQAIKGMLRSFIIQEYFKKCPNGCNTPCEKGCEKKALSHKGFSLIFGGKSNNGEDIQGRVIFMDSFPYENFIIKKDIITSHHKDYYCKNKFPLDTDETNPIAFLVVENSQFEINIGIDKKVCAEQWCKNSNKNIEEFIVESFRNALRFHGLGAKTSAGYGYFEEVDEKK